jgi:hypothetical protein
MTRTAKFLAYVLAITLALPLFGAEDKMENLGLDPGARGTIHTDTDENGNTRIKVDVEHMATPQQLTPAHQNYVVWVQPKGQPPKLAGELKVNDAKAKLETTTPAKVFDVLVTAEDQLNPTSPSSNIVLRGHVERS